MPLRNTLMLDTKDVGWGMVWPAVQADEDFGKQVILGISNDYDSMGFRLNEDQLADLYVWLTRHFEASPEHNSGEAVGLDLLSLSNGGEMPSFSF